MKRKVCVVTGTRAEYGLFYWLLREISNDPELDLRIIATGMHLSPEFGLTYREIEKDGFHIHKKLEVLLSSDTPVGISKSMGLAHIVLAEAYEELKPDLVVLLGDRFETLCAAAAACVARIPVAHIAGGETTQGAFDEAFRHGITKMSHLHFTSTEEYRRRVVQLGESPDRVFNVGALGVENIKRLSLLSREELAKEIGFQMGERCLLVTFHPVTLEKASAGAQFQALLDALDGMSDARVVFTKANADTDGRIINQMIDGYAAANPERTVAFTSMGRLRYLSAMKYAAAVVGNSSSGIVETPSFRIPTINIGDRQKGRMQAASVINCGPEKDGILAALEKAFSPEFQRLVKDVTSPYEKDDPAGNIKEVIKKFDLTGILKKEFHDLPVNIDV